MKTSVTNSTICCHGLHSWKHRSRRAYGAFPLPNSDIETYIDSYSNEMYKGSTGTYSDDDTNAKLQCKLVEKHIICTDISAKLGTVAICIGMGIGIRIGSAYTLLNTIVEPNFIGRGVGIGLVENTPLNSIEAHPIRHFLRCVRSPDYYGEIILRIKLLNLRQLCAEVRILNA